MCDRWKIIDAHAHLARTADEQLYFWPARGRRTCDAYGTPERVISYMDRMGVRKMALMVLIARQVRYVLSNGTNAHLTGRQLGPVGQETQARVASLLKEMNEWGCGVGQRFPRLAPFVCLAKELGGAEGMVRELRLRVAQGAKGVKLHPGLFSAFPADPEFWPVYEQCQEMGLPIVADSGPKSTSRVFIVHQLWYGSPEEHVEYAEPMNWAPVLEAFPRLTLVLAHLGSAWWDERVELAQKYSNVYFDTSQGFSAPDRIPMCPHRALAEEDAARVMRRIGVARIMFGSDLPALDPSAQLEQILRLPLDDREEQMILGANAERILRI
jgi:hypothetical protein